MCLGESGVDAVCQLRSAYIYTRPYPSRNPFQVRRQLHESLATRMPAFDQPSKGYTGHLERPVPHARASYRLAIPPSDDYHCLAHAVLCELCGGNSLSSHGRKKRHWLVRVVIPCFMSSASPYMHKDILKHKGSGYHALDVSRKQRHCSRVHRRYQINCRSPGSRADMQDPTCTSTITPPTFFSKESPIYSTLLAQ